MEVFFKFHSWATERKKGKKWVQKKFFLANGKSLNNFYMFIFIVSMQNALLEPVRLPIVWNANNQWQALSVH